MVTLIDIRHVTVTCLMSVKKTKERMRDECGQHGSKSPVQTPSARVTEERLKETSGSLYGRTQGSLISLSKHFASGLKLTEVTNQTER